MGWIAGDIHAFPAHLGKPSHVCEKTLGVRDAECPKCKKGAPVNLVGYLPVYRDDNKPCVLVLHEHTFDQIGTLPHLCPVQWGRRKAEQNEPVWVRRMMKGPTYKTSLPERLRPQDLVFPMVRYWRRRDLFVHLARWMGVASAVKAAMVVEEPVAVSEVSEARPFERPKTTARQAIKAVTGEDPGELLSQTAKNMLRRAREREQAAEVNGVHE